MWLIFAAGKSGISGSTSIGFTTGEAATSSIGICSIASLGYGMGSGTADIGAEGAKGASNGAS
jgi:hypothetical protein